ncbi:VUT family protein, partial [Rothia aeria]
MSTPTNEARPDTTNVPVPWAGKRRYFDLLLGASCVILIISNIAATKSIEFGPLPFEFPPFTNGNFIPSDGGFFLYPLAYVLGDVLSEVYGFKRARRAIIASFVAAAFAAG